MVQASLHTLGSMKCTYSHSCAGPAADTQSWSKTRITLPQAQPVRCLHCKSDTAWQWGEEGVCVRFFVSIWGAGSPKDNLSPWGPQWPETLLFVGVYVRGQCIYEQKKMCGCVCVCKHAQRAIPFEGTLVMKSNLSDWIHDGRRYQ